MHAFSTLARYWRLFARYMQTQWGFLGVLAGILAGSIATRAVAPLVASRFIDDAVAGATQRHLILLALLTMALAIVGQILTVGETWVAERIGWTATNTLRADLLAHLLRLDASFHNAHTPGELIERVDGDVSTLERFFSRFVVYVIGNLVLMLTVLVLLWRVEWRVGAALSAFVVLALISMLRIRAAATPHWARERQGRAEFFGFLGEYLSGTEDVRSSGAGAFVLRRCAQMMRAWHPAYFRAGMWGYGIGISTQALFALGAAASLALGAYLYRAEVISIGAVYLLFHYTTMLRQPTEQIRNEIQDFQQADASISRVQALLQTTPRLVDGPGLALPSGPLSVELDNVVFAYSDGAPVIQGVSVTVAPGRILGIVGRTGSGKTTLMRLLLRFFDPQHGTVRIGGVDLRHVRLAAVRQRIGLVSQDVTIFNASVRDTLTLFDPRVSDERLHEVLQMLGMGDWLRDLPQGLQTMLGAGQVGLSAGQAQILACARIFLNNPDIVILDEASSRLDPVTERQVHTAFERLLTGRTGIIVAHRLSTIAFADDILILEDGCVREYGPRLSLAANPMSRFSQLLRTAGEEALV